MAASSEEVVDLYSKISDSLVPKEDSHGKKFLPDAKLRELVNKESVAEYLRTKYWEEEPGRISSELISFIVQNAPRLFATLVMAGSADSIEAFYKLAFGQDRLSPLLPLADKDIKRGIVNNFAVGNFRIWQWKFLAPVFEKGRFRYTFGPEEILPFTNDISSVDNRDGGYGYVSKRSIHASHIEIPSGQHMDVDDDNNPWVAVKKMRVATDAAREATSLEKIQEFNNGHIIRPIAYYQCPEGHFFVFPWAEKGNLWDLIMNNTPNMEEGFLVWAFEQLAGLAQALAQLHADPQTELHDVDPESKTSHTRHGDLKPDNILCFQRKSDTVKPFYSGVRLVITDFGLAKVQVKATKQRSTTQTSVSTLRYQAPELRTKGKRLSRVFDVWSLGCIYLEFAIWLVLGQEELKLFNEGDREFYMLKDDQNAIMDPEVGKCMKKIREHPSCCGAIKKLVDLVDKELLVVSVKTLDEDQDMTHYRASARDVSTEMEKIARDLKNDGWKPVTAVNSI
ncbi:kinase-like domain-containing protein [Lasiosphaeria miniovina]|uniref:Kinase-like domain-containing protein n=1 Tax=Lasiosphaeria miniovina TaxID=1954250 RepID=A0AA40A0R1_9PEZI|nr:kinase-like domain-containing protein [Lasiosphaeria miniovina]KAK0707055.1 kinase-like domain-containing protein [Lasiosphaeria miniovina]